MPFFNVSWFFLVAGLIFTTTLEGQSPPQPGFSYQAVARDNTGSPLVSEDLTVRMTIMAGSDEGDIIWQEDHDVRTNNIGLFTLVVGGTKAYGQSGKVDDFADIDWSANQYYLHVMVNKDGSFLDMGGSPIQTVPVAHYARTAKGSEGNFSVRAQQPGGEDEALFEVRRSDGSVAFAVYEDMVWVYADDDGAKGIKGGFAVGGYSANKAAPAQEFLRVTPDSVRVYINDDNTKGVKGGFAVGGYSSNKAPSEQYLSVSGNNPVDEDYSISLGVGADASGPYSTAIGYQSEASASNAIALGNGALASGTDAASMGYQSRALGSKSIAIGSYYNYSFNSLPYFNYGKKGDTKAPGDFIIWDPIITPIFTTITFNRANIAEGQYSIAFGNGNYANAGGMALGSNNDADGFGAVALGVSNQATNTNAFAAGYNSDATGFYATAIGNNATAQAYGSFVIGQYNNIGGTADEWINYDPLFVVGNGLNNDNRSNALTINKNGQTTFLGEDASTTLNYRFSFYNFISGTWFRTVYGVRSYINRADPDVGSYYSGYFYDTGSEGTYYGFYADERSGGAIDLAEYIYDSYGDTEAGDVLIADPAKKESVIVSNQPYQSSVVGVVSTKPHLTMGMELVVDEKTGAPLPDVQATRLALTGRVPCKVTDENGPIEPGDLLTSSSTPGHAMKWTPVDLDQAADFQELKALLTENEMRRHAVIGKALESHSGGTGKIMVLVSLQ